LGYTSQSLYQPKPICFPLAWPLTLSVEKVINIELYEQ